MRSRGAWAAALLIASLLGLGGCGHIVVLHDPLTAAEHNDLGVAYERAGRLDLAAREYRKAVRLDPSSAGARVNAGNAAAARNRWSEAERWYRSALRLSPEDGDALNNLAWLLARRGRKLDEAERLASRAVAAGGRDSVYRATLDEVRRARTAGPSVRSPRPSP
jgi:Flp pilus assembly protein TadD